jgi:polyphosphate glucokinase
MNVLVVDVGGTNVKILATGQGEPRKFPSGTTLTAAKMVEGVRKLAGDWKYDAVAIGYPGPVVHDRPMAEPHNLAPGWVEFDYAKAFGLPVKIINDAAMQALGSYNGGKLLFLGLGTGLGTTLVIEGVVEPMELAHLPYRKATYEDYVGLRALEEFGKKKWRKHVADVVARLTAAFDPNDVVLGGGNAKKLAELPPRCRLGENANAFLGGFRLWQETGRAVAIAPEQTGPAGKRKSPARKAPVAKGKPAARKKAATTGKRKPAATGKASAGKGSGGAPAKPRSGGR